MMATGHALQRPDAPIKRLFWDRRLWGGLGLSRAMHPQHGWCGRCRLSWAVVRHHTTWMPDGKTGVFALCCACWADLAPATRLPYYLQTCDDWAAQSESADEDADIAHKRVLITAAVLAEDL